MLTFDTLHAHSCVYPYASTPYLFVCKLPNLIYPSIQITGQLATLFATALEFIYILTSGYISFCIKWMFKCTTLHSMYRRIFYFHCLSRPLLRELQRSHPPFPDCIHLCKANPDSFLLLQLVMPNPPYSFMCELGGSVGTTVGGTMGMFRLLFMQLTCALWSCLCSILDVAPFLWGIASLVTWLISCSAWWDVSLCAHLVTTDRLSVFTRA